MIDSVRGRAVSRFSESDAEDGFSAALTVLRYARATTDSAKAAAWKAAAKGWLQRNTSCTVPDHGPGGAPPTRLGVLAGDVVFGVHQRRRRVLLPVAGGC